MSSTPHYFLPHVQGLRAIAVLLVVIYHFWPGRLTGGYVGVDIFFVISGFLITQQLSREIDRTGSVKLLSFWGKRVRRLLPASLLVLLFSAIMTLTIMPLSALAENVREIFASALYFENWALAANAVDYLAASNDASLVQHYWSLSLEEQFYVIWPVLLIAAAAVALRVGGRGRAGGDAAALAASRGRQRGMLALIVGVTVVSLGLSVWATLTDPAAAYFVTYTRGWEFGVGAILALLPALRPKKAWAGNLLGYAGVLALLYTAFRFDPTTPFPGYTALLPVLGTAAVIASHPTARWFDIGRVLGARVPRFIGDISYSLYLWHWPLIIIAPFVPGWGLSIYNRIALLALCFLLAWLTKRFVEDPARTWRFWVARRPRVTFAFMAAGLAVIVAVVGGVSVIQQPKYDQASAQLQQTVANPPECFGAASAAAPVVTGTSAVAVQTQLAAELPGAASGCSNAALADTIIPSAGFGNADRPANTQCLVTLNDSTLYACHFGSGDPAAKRVALIGDSHAFALLDPFITMAEQSGWSLTTYIKGGCAWNTDPMPGLDAFSVSCTTWRSNLTNELASVQPYDAVFTAALADETAPGTSADGTALATGFAGAFAEVTSRGTPVVTLVDNPSWSDDPNKCLRTSSPSDCVEPRSDGLVADPPIALAAASAEAAGQNVTLLDFSSTYCSTDDCFAVIGGANVYRDQDHLTNTFATTLGPYLKAAVTAVMTP